MQLATYLTENQLTLAEFAEQIDRSAATVSRIARGVHRPDWPTMQAIEAATGGKVRPDDFREPPPPTPTQPQVAAE